MNLRDLVNGLVEQKLLVTHTAFLAKVTAVAAGGKEAGVQPLTLAKAQNGEPYAQPLLPAAPVLRGVAVAVGDTVLCVVCERDIAAAKHGRMALPAPRRHDLADCVVVGVVG